MKVWVHKLTVGGKTRYFENAAFGDMYAKNSYKMPKENEWVPMKVAIPDEYKPQEEEDGRITIEDLEGKRVDFSDVLDISPEDDGPIMKMHDAEFGEMHVNLFEVDP